MAMLQMPSMGRIVHYVDESGDAFPAIIRAVMASDPEIVHLTAFVDIGESAVLRADGVPYCGDDDHKPFSWHWPERV